MNEICTCELMHLFQLSARAVIGLQLKQIPAAVFSGQQHLLFGAIHNSCKPSVKHRYSCFTTFSGGRCPPHSPPAREITSPLTPECRLRRFFIIYLKVNAVALPFFHYYLTKIASYVIMLKLLTERSGSIAFRKKIPFDRPDTYAGAVIDIFH